MRTMQQILCQELTTESGFCPNDVDKLTRLWVVFPNSIEKSIVLAGFGKKIFNGIMKKNGFGLIEVLVSILIMSAFIWATQKALVDVQQAQMGSQLGFDLVNARNNLLNILNQDEVWNQIQQNNANMA